mmetsp:Transcript_33098/g.84148  ORF Transcript_33098/g.84148 Transcript_33098/m.84148 type:complete len:205 (+) Transcript_33098:424-1038(+)
MRWSRLRLGSRRLVCHSSRADKSGPTGHSAGASCQAPAEPLCPHPAPPPPPPFSCPLPTLQLVPPEVRWQQTRPLPRLRCLLPTWSGTPQRPARHRRLHGRSPLRARLRASPTSHLLSATPRLCDSRGRALPRWTRCRLHKLPRPRSEGLSNDPNLQERALPVWERCDRTCWQRAPPMARSRRGAARGPRDDLGISLQRSPSAR